jgi:hypothetical protein
MKRSFWILGLAAALVRAPLGAAFFGNPALPIEKGKGTLEFAYETGDRDAKDTSGAGGTFDLHKHAFFLQGRLALSDVFQVSGRFVPGTGRVSFPNGGGFNPKLWGLGAGLRFSPPEAMGPVRLGVLAGWDWAFGSSERPGALSGSDKINWAEGTVAAGASVELHEMAHAYGGGSLVKPDVHLDLNGTETNVEADAVFGGFLGVDFRPHEAWNIGVEKHFGNEDTVGLALSYFF